MLATLLANELACPICRSSLKKKNETVVCQDCATSYPILDGVPAFIVQPDNGVGDTINSSIDVSVLILAMNEEENLRHALKETRKVLDYLGITYEIVIVDGGSKDATVSCALSFGARVHVQTQPGYGNAFREGVKLVKGRYLLTLDADLSHDPNYIQALWDRRHSAEAHILSRYTPGGEAIMPLSRRLLSRMLSLVFSQVLSVPVADLSSGFRLYKTSAIKGLKLEGSNFDVLVEVMVKLYNEGYRISETPMFYKPRGEGQSHVRLFNFAKSYAKAIWRLWLLRKSVAAADYDSLAYHSIIWPQRQWQRLRYAAILRLLGGQTSSILDVGCGSSKIIQSLPGAVGLDILLRKVRFLRRIHPNLVNGTVFQLPFKDESFETVICSELLEQLDDRQKAMAELVRVLKPGGRLILGTPDHGRLSWRLIKPIYQWIIPGGYASEHITPWNRKDLHKLLASHDIEFIEETYIAGSEWIGLGRKPLKS